MIVKKLLSYRKLKKPTDFNLKFVQNLIRNEKKYASFKGY